MYTYITIYALRIRNVYAETRLVVIIKRGSVAVLMWVHWGVTREGLGGVGACNSLCRSAAVLLLDPSDAFSCAVICTADYVIFPWFGVLLLPSTVMWMLHSFDRCRHLMSCISLYN